MFDFLLVSFLNDDLSVSNTDEDLVADIHARHLEFVLVEIEVDVVVVPVLVFGAAWTQLLFPDHRGVLTRTSLQDLLKCFLRNIDVSRLVCRTYVNIYDDFHAHNQLVNDVGVASSLKHTGAVGRFWGISLCRTVC